MGHATACMAPSVFQTIMGKELRLRQRNFGSYSMDRVFLQENDDARDILGATCTVLEDKSKVWHVKMPQFIEMEIGTPSMMPPALRMLSEDESDLNEYLDDPTDPVLCSRTGS